MKINLTIYNIMNKIHLIYVFDLHHVPQFFFVKIFCVVVHQFHTQIVFNLLITVRAIVVTTIQSQVKELAFGMIFLVF